MPRSQSLPLIMKNNCAVDPEDKKCKKCTVYSYMMKNNYAARTTRNNDNYLRQLMRD